MLLKDDDTFQRLEELRDRAIVVGIVRGRQLGDRCRGRGTWKIQLAAFKFIVPCTFKLRLESRVKNFVWCLGNFELHY
jgi:hypothetical protein